MVKALGSRKGQPPRSMWKTPSKDAGSACPEWNPFLRALTSSVSKPFSGIIGRKSLRRRMCFIQDFLAVWEAGRPYASRRFDVLEGWAAKKPS